MFSSAMPIRFVSTFAGRCGATDTVTVFDPETVAAIYPLSKQKARPSRYDLAGQPTSVMMRLPFVRLHRSLLRGVHRGRAQRTAGVSLDHNHRLLLAVNVFPLAFVREGFAALMVRRNLFFGGLTGCDFHEVPGCNGRADFAYRAVRAALRNVAHGRDVEEAGRVFTVQRLSFL